MFSNFWGSHPEEGWLDHVILELHTLSDSGLIGSAVLQFPPVPTSSHPFPPVPTRSHMLLLLLVQRHAVSSGLRQLTHVPTSASHF